MATRKRRVEKFLAGIEVDTGLALDSHQRRAVRKRLREYEAPAPSVVLIVNECLKVSLERVSRAVAEHFKRLDEKWPGLEVVGVWTADGEEGPEPENLQVVEMFECLWMNYRNLTEAQAERLADDFRKIVRPLIPFEK